jgi:hypothetical protein
LSILRGIVFLWTGHSKCSPPQPTLGWLGGPDRQVSGSLHVRTVRVSGWGASQPRSVEENLPSPGCPAAASGPRIGFPLHVLAPGSQNRLKDAMRSPCGILMINLSGDSKRRGCYSKTERYQNPSHNGPDDQLLVLPTAPSNFVHLHHMKTGEDYT